MLLAAGISTLMLLILLFTRRRKGGVLQSLILLVLPLLAFLLNGHTRSREPMWLMMLSDTSHVIAGSIWLGGIVILVLGLSGRWRGDGFAAVSAVAQFSSFAMYTVFILMISGVLMAFAILDEFRALYESEWGRHC